MRLFLKSLIIGLLLLGLSLPTLAFDKKPGKLKEWDNAPVAENGKKYADLENTVVRINVIGSATGRFWEFNSETDRYDAKIAIGTFGQTGSGFVVKSIDGKLYIITAAHVLNPHEIIIVASNHIRQRTWPIKIINRIIFAGGDSGIGYECEIVYENVEYDWAIIRPKGYAPAMTPLSPPLANIKEDHMIGEGDAVGIIVNQRDEEDLSKTCMYEVRYGNVVSPGPVAADTKHLPWFSLNDVTIDVIIFPGDSGSPVIMWENGEPFIVGIARAIYYCDGVYYAYFTRIDGVTFLLKIPNSLP